MMKLFDDVVQTSIKEIMMQKAKDYGMPLYCLDDEELWADKNCKTLLRAMELKIPIEYIQGAYSWSAIEAMVKGKEIGLKNEAFENLDRGKPGVPELTTEQELIKLTVSTMICDNCGKELEIDLFSDKIYLNWYEIMIDCPICGANILLDFNLVTSFKISIDKYLKWLQQKS